MTSPSVSHPRAFVRLREESPDLRCSVADGTLVEARFKELYGGGSDDVRVEGSGDELVVFVREREFDGGWRLSPSGNFITLFTHALDCSVDFPLVQYRNRHDVGLVLKTRDTDKLLCTHQSVDLVAAVLDDNENWQPTEFATVRQVQMMATTRKADSTTPIEC
jgi:hypothetical protein